MSIFISLSPNTEPDDIRLAFRTLFRPWLWKKEETLKQVTGTISRIFNEQPVALVSSGRSALYQTLKAFNISANDEVIIQAFTCLAVPAAIKWTKAKPVYVDIHPDTYNINASQIIEAITKNTKAIIVQHTFGIPGPIEELQQIAREHNLILIEDLAHSLGSTYHRKPLGTFGDAAILSFGRDKIISSVFGGAVISNRKDVINKINDAQEKLPFPPAHWIIQQLNHPILFSIIKSTYFTMHIGKIFLVLLQKTSLLSKAVQEKEKGSNKPNHISYRYSPALALLLQNQLTKLDSFNERRREIIQTYFNTLSNHSDLPQTTQPSNPTWLRFPLKVNQPPKLHNQARKQKILLGDWYNSSIAPVDADSKIFNYIKGSCPIAEKTAEHIVNLPTYPTITNRQVEQIIKLINSYED
jgi:dTDP-4-amino-4,6-dideoxygalactose transaminase